jgi:hypothetical protein
MKENAIGGAAAGLYLRHPTNARGRLHRSAPEALAGDPASGPVPRMLTGRGRFAQLGARRIPQGSPGARSAAGECLSRPLCVARRAEAGRARHPRAPHDGDGYGAHGSAFAGRDVGSAIQATTRARPHPPTTKGTQTDPLPRPSLACRHLAQYLACLAGVVALLSSGRVGSQRAHRVPERRRRVPQQAPLRGPSGCSGACTSSARTT